MRKIKKEKSNYWERLEESNSAMSCQGYNTHSAHLWQLHWKKKLQKDTVCILPPPTPLMPQCQLPFVVLPSWYVVSRDTLKLVWNPRIQIVKDVIRVPVMYIFSRCLGSFQGFRLKLVIILIIWVHNPPSVELTSTEHKWCKMDKQWLTMNHTQVTFQWNLLWQSFSSLFADWLFRESRSSLSPKSGKRENPFIALLAHGRISTLVP